MKDAIIRLENVSKRFGPNTAVDDISFDVRTGEVFAFLGPNGAGKSTTIKMLTTLLRPTSGTILMNGHDVVAHPDQVRQTFGIVFQDPSVDNELTAYENMELHAALYSVPQRERRGRIEQLLELMELSGRAGDYVKTYSGGMIRRLEIARGLLHHPKVLFLDEPTLGLDTQTRTLLWNYISRLNTENGMTVFMTTHYIEEAQNAADRIAVIDHGKIVAMGTTKELEKLTQTKSLEEAYLALTGREVRDEEAETGQAMRLRARRR